ncbi:MAG: hypothetical protein NTW86_12500 [Candidatus Sumerlaeota bacterium]|nr:hypothetical protein [Candidatus Sumerlaeota bacterium]
MPGCFLRPRSICRRVFFLSVGILFAVFPLWAGAPGAGGSSLAAADSALDWTPFLGAGPPARTNHAMAWDSDRKRTVLYAGTSTSPYSDTWEFDGSAWLQMSPAHNPGPASQHCLAYDPMRKRMVYFNAYPSPSTWEYDGIDWSAVATPHVPGVDPAAAMEWCSALGKVVLFGEAAGSGAGRTWTYDGTDWAPLSPAHSPAGRSGHGLVADTARNRLVVFGGYGGGGVFLNDTWEFDGVDWVQVPTADSPPAGDAMAMAYDAGLQCAVLCTGGTYQNWHNQTWLYDGSNWVRIQTTNQPSARYEARVVYDAWNEGLVFFGGFNGSHQADTWLGQAVEPTPGPPLMGAVLDQGGGWARLSWSNAGRVAPAQILLCVFDLYDLAWKQYGAGMWLPISPADSQCNVNMERTGGYHIWVSNLYGDGAWFPCENPWTGIQYSGFPHAPLHVEATDLGSLRARLRWRADFYGAWHMQAIAYKGGEGWVPIEGPDGIALWHFFPYPGASFLYGEAEFTMPSPGEYWFYLRGIGWLPPYPAGPYATAFLSVGP